MVYIFVHRQRYIVGQDEDTEVNIDVCVCMDSMVPQWQWAHTAPGTWFLIPFSNKRNKRSLEKSLILYLGQQKHKVNLEHLVLPESRKYTVKDTDL